MLRGWVLVPIVALVGGIGSASSGCVGGGSAFAGAPDASDSDAGIPGAPTITITTWAPSSSEGPRAKTNATWAAARREDGVWFRLTPVDTGLYGFQVKGDRWAVAFVCSDGSDTLVAVHEDAIGVTSLDLTLERWCIPQPAPPVTITGILTNVAAETSWLDFGYGLEARGVALPLTGSRAEYEEVNVAAGTWDIAFGVRNQAASPLSRIALVRNHRLDTDGKLDIDLATAIVPETRRLVLHGIDASNENLAAPVYFAAQGNERGIDLGPQSAPNAADVDLLYSTIPAFAEAEGDRYRFEPKVTTSDDDGARGFVLSLHQAIDLDLAFREPLALPPTVGIATSPYVRLEARTPFRPQAERYELEVVGRINNRRSRHWRVSLGAALVSGGDAVLTLPDFGAIDGFDANWVLPADQRRDATTTVRDRPVAHGDGQLVHFASRLVILEP